MSTEEELIGRIKLLSERVWEGRCRAPDLDRWLSNFDGSALGNEDSERLHALHLLAHMSYFGLTELRVLLRALYRDLFRYPLVQELRQNLGGTRDVDVVRAAFESERDATRFLGMGNPAESGTHLLYYFRQENRLNKSLFIQPQELFSGPVSDPDTRLVPADIKRVVLIDDLCASGSQAVAYSMGLLQDLREVGLRDGRMIDFQYFVLFGTDRGLETAKTGTSFSTVAAVSQIDDSYQTFAQGARVFRKKPADVDQALSHTMATSYGSMLWPSCPLGYGNCQLLLAFHHNVPDNTLPIIWYDDQPTWYAAIPRHHKVY